jgi:hypothetical protein
MRPRTARRHGGFLLLWTLVIQLAIRHTGPAVGDWLSISALPGLPASPD